MMRAAVSSCARWLCLCSQLNLEFDNEDEPSMTIDAMIPQSGGFGARAQVSALFVCRVFVLFRCGFDGLAADWVLICCCFWSRAGHAIEGAGLQTLTANGNRALTLSCRVSSFNVVLSLFTVWRCAALPRLSYCAIWLVLFNPQTLNTRCYLLVSAAALVRVLAPELCVLNLDLDLLFSSNALAND